MLYNTTRFRETTNGGCKTLVLHSFGSKNFKKRGLMTNKKLTLFIVTYDFSFSKCIDGGEVYRRRGWREEVGSGGERHFKLDKGPSPI